MSSESPVIQVCGVSKCFEVYDKPANRLRQMLANKAHRTFGYPLSKYYREFWALRNIEFEVGKGQTVGVIGQNGGGKSTLLQIITGTMSPTHGSVNVNGKIAALLQLGSGFNPEFTGRENVYLNGSLLGLTKEEVDNKFDYIAGFADIGDYLDQPVKSYSSGMMLRLAFAVQVAIETEVLIIDEALAVGDVKFQRKCFKRMEEIKDNGTTILFVSHSTEMMRSFCNAGLVLEKGEMVFWGDAKAATVKYLASVFPDQTTPSRASPETGDEVASIGGAAEREDDEAILVHPDESEVHTFGVGGAELNWLKIYGLEAPNIATGGREIKVVCRFSWGVSYLESLISGQGYKNDITLGITVSDRKGTYLFGCNGFDHNIHIDCLANKHSMVEFTFKMPHLVPGDYFLSVAIALGNLENHVQLKWYDGLLQLKCFEGGRKAFGVMAIDYEMKQIE